MKCSGPVCRALTEKEYTKAIKDDMRKYVRAICVMVTATQKANSAGAEGAAGVDGASGAKKTVELPLMFYEKRAPSSTVPYCDANRVIGVKRLMKLRLVKVDPALESPGGTARSAAQAKQTYVAVCERALNPDPILAKLTHVVMARKKTFSPKVATLKSGDVPLADKLDEHIKSGRIQRVKRKKGAKSDDVSAICTVCSFYHKVPDEMNMPGCYYIYRKRTCPHTTAAYASGDAKKYATTEGVKFEELAKYTVTDEKGTVDLARWIFAKFRGTGYKASGTCVSDTEKESERESAMREKDTRLGFDSVPGPVALGSLRVVA